MRLNKIYIAAFGGLKDFTLDLNDGLNVIYGNNEDGKSTVAAFIKAMFYGTGRNTKNLAESIRQKYTPWDGSQMAGRIYFTHGNKNYCLEREFRKSDSTDRITLTDLDSGKEKPTQENIGQQFFGLSAAAFERSLFIGNGDFIKDDTAAGEINAKLSNVAVTGSEDTSYQKIQKTLSDAKGKVISKTGRAGSYIEDTRLCDELNNRLTRADEDARKKTALNENIAKNRVEYEMLYKKYLSLKEIIDSENDIKNREKLAEYLEIKKQLDTINESLKLADGTTIDESFIKKVNFGLGKYEKITDRCDELKNDIAKIKESIELQNQNSPESAKQQIDELSAKVEKLSREKDVLAEKQEKIRQVLLDAEQKLSNGKAKKKAVNPILLIFALVLAAVTIATVFFTLPLATVVLGVVTAVLLVLSFVLKPQNKSFITDCQNEISRLNAELNEIKANKNLIAEEINNLAARINTLSSVLNADAAVKAQRQNDLNDKLNSLSEEKSKQAAALNEIKEYLSRFGNLDSVEQIKESLLSLEKQTNEQKQLKLQLSYLSRDLGNISYGDAAEKLRQMRDANRADTADIEAAKAEFEAVSEQLSQLKDAITESLTELKTSFRHSENPEDIRRELKEVTARMTSKKEFCDTIDMALEVLEESFYELRRGYGSELEKVTHSIFSHLTNGKYKSINVNDTLDMSVEKVDVFGTRELDYLSLGTTHQAYLSLRLAIATLIGGDAPLPIFLDDSLSQYDDNRAEHAISFLKDFCENGQGVLFTCHNSICDIAKRQNITIKTPYQK